MPKCRYCGEPGAYDSGFTVECCNVRCEHYNEDQRINRADKALKKIKQDLYLKEYLQEENTDPDKTPTFHWGIGNPLDDTAED